MRTERRLADFEGAWSIEREITQADGGQASFVGTARFSRTSDGALDYLEDGTLSLGATTSMRATRRYRWEEGLNVFFDDGRPFHQIPASGGKALHLCPPDEYRVSYDFSDWPNWRATWDVTGPKKAYRMTSVYAPASGSG